MQYSKTNQQKLQHVRKIREAFNQTDGDSDDEFLNVLEEMGYDLQPQEKKTSDRQEAELWELTQSGLI